MWLNIFWALCFSKFGSLVHTGFSEYIFCSLCPFLKRNRYITIRKFYCQDKEIKKTDHFRLPSMAQKRCMILSSPIVF